MGGVYQCSYHPLFDCDPNINVFYTWNNNDPQTITAKFPAPVQMVNIVTYSSRFTSATVRVQLKGSQAAGTGNSNIKITLPSEVNEINPLTISTGSALVTSIIFCGRNGL